MTRPKESNESSMFVLDAVVADMPVILIAISRYTTVIHIQHITIRGIGIQFEACSNTDTYMEMMFAFA